MIVNFYTEYYYYYYYYLLFIIIIIIIIINIKNNVRNKYILIKIIKKHTYEI